METSSAAREPDFVTLVEELERIQHRRAPGGSFEFPEDAVRLQRIERQIIAMVRAESRLHERRVHQRVLCDAWVTVRLPGADQRALVMDVGLGGVFIAADVLSDIGDPVEIVVDPQPRSTGGPLRVYGHVAWRSDAREGRRAGFGVAFTWEYTAEGAERRLRRFVLGLLKRRVAPRRDPTTR